jgi:hypothetical protein
MVLEEVDKTDLIRRIFLSFDERFRKAGTVHRLRWDFGRPGSVLARNVRMKEPNIEVAGRGPSFVFSFFSWSVDRLCCLMVRVPTYRARGPGFRYGRY